MGKDNSTRAILTAIKRLPCFKKTNVIVLHNGNKFIYKNITVRITDNIPYMQIDVSVFWEDDKKQIDYKKLGLHGNYNTNFQDFSFENNKLSWKDGNNTIYMDFS